MSHTPSSSLRTPGPSPLPGRAASEAGLVRRLTIGQQVMMAIGGAIGTGLFLGSGLTVGAAGPSVVVSYVIGGGIALLLGAALTELAVALPAAGSFGLQAERFVSPFAGYAVRVSYWLMQVIATGGHMVAIATYMRFWFPDVPAAVWIVVVAASVTWLNTREVGAFGTFEYWFAMIKVVAILLFLGLALTVVAGFAGSTAPGLANWTAHGGFAPHGLWGIWVGTVFALYSYISIEIVAVTAGEASDPARTIPVAMRRTVLALGVLYVSTIALVVAVAPWRELGVGESPFVTVLRATGVPAAAGLMNFVVLSAALSSANANLYLCTRMLFSLARGGFVPSSLGRLDARGVPARAAIVSSLGLGLAVVLQMLWGNSAAYTWFFGVALFGALFVWLMIFVTHLRFRREYRLTGVALPHEVRFGAASSWLGVAAVVSVLATTWWVPALRVTLLVSIPWLALLALGYRLARRSRTAAVLAAGSGGHA